MILAKILRSQQLISENVKSRAILSWIVNAFSVAAVIFSIISVVIYTTVVRVDSETNGDEYFARDASMIYMYFGFEWFQVAGYAVPLFMIISGSGYFFAKLDSREAWAKNNVTL